MSPSASVIVFDVNETLSDMSPMAGRFADIGAPEDTVEKLSDKAHVPVPGEGDARQNRVAGLGALTGLVAGGRVGGGPRRRVAS